MEEDIKVLEDLIAFLNTNGDYIADENLGEEKLAIENLIKGYRELEKRNATLRESGIIKIKKIQELEEKVRELNYGLERQIRVKEEEFIPKSKIKEKIEELEEEFGKLFIIGNPRSFDMCRAKMDILQELMEDK